MVEIYLFDNLRVVVGGEPLPIRSEKLRTLLAYLLLHRRQPVDRTQVARAIWPESDESTARRNLREYLYRLRTLLDESWPFTLETDGDTLTFDPAAWVDVDAFEALLDDDPPLGEATTALGSAVDLYQGDLLAGIYEPWVMPEQQRLRQRYMAALHDLAGAYHTVGSLPAAAAAVRRLLSLEPLDEAAHRLLMRLYMEAGDRARALQQYAECRQLLADELAAEPLPETTELYQSILEGIYQPHTPVAPKPAVRPAAPFVGRTADLEQLAAAFRSGAHTIALVTGSTGIGKTRMVNEWMDDLRTEVLALRGRSHELERAIPYQPLLDAIQQSLNLIPWEELPAVEWLAPLARLLPDLYYHVPHLETADSADDHAILEGLTQLLLTLTHRTTVVLFIDDLHWADQATWDCLGFLVRRAQGRPLFIVGTFSAEEASDAARRRLHRLERHTPVTHIPLGALDESQLTELLAVRLHSPQLALRLHQLSGGKPFFAAEIIAALQAAKPDGPYTPADLNRFAIPDAVRVLIQYRLDRLSAPSSLALATAAAINRPFTVDLLAAGTGRSDAELLDEVDVWLARGLITAIPDGLDFAHEQVRQVAYEQLSPPRQKRIHARIAEALSAQFGPHSEEVAFHHAQSHFPDRTGHTGPANADL
ncbi:MAG: AAA family ATPase [Anaerolineae bacterium]